MVSKKENVMDIVVILLIALLVLDRATLWRGFKSTDSLDSSE